MLAKSHEIAHVPVGILGYYIICGDNGKWMPRNMSAKKFLYFYGK